MTDLERVASLLVISAGVVFLAWSSRRAAMDMDERGYPGWIFGILVLVLPPIGFLAWLLFRALRAAER